MDNIAGLIKQYNEIKEKGLRLDMSRGKPSPKQLDTAEGFLLTVKGADCISENGLDCRNYGALDGIPEAKRIFAEMLGLENKNIVICGASSLHIMFDTIQRCFYRGVGKNMKPWNVCGKVKFLCPVPGYDRHFAITEYFGIEMINVPMDERGPDMGFVTEAIKDPCVKGIWCVPKYSNPTGITYSDETVKALASMKPAADDFRIFWDNAYAVHDLTDTPDTLLNIFSECKKYGNENMVFAFASTAKITFAGGGLACFASSEENVKSMLAELQFKTICYDKVNQLRHARWLSGDGLMRQMKAHRELIEPKFAIVDEIFSKELSDMKGISWTKPNGGYFITLSLPKGHAVNVVRLAREAGLILTPAGATHPYGIDPDDSVIRIAPTYPDLEELEQAAVLLCICIKISVNQNF